MKTPKLIGYQLKDEATRLTVDSMLFGITSEHIPMSERTDPDAIPFRDVPKRRMSQLSSDPRLYFIRGHLGGSLVAKARELGILLTHFNPVYETAEIKDGMQYSRVIPRDFFNESKLLKCMGRLMIVSGEKVDLGFKITFDNDGSPFEIVQDPSDGSIFISNVKVLVDGNPCTFSTSLNSKSPYPMVCDFFGEFTEVFTDEGEFCEDFVRFCEGLSTTGEAPTDLFEDPDSWSPELRAVIEEHTNDGDGMTYEECKTFVEMLERIGYTCDYGLDASPFDLKKISE